MGRRKRGEVPPYRRHISGQAFSVYQGESYYHGKHGSAESRRKYKEFLAWWERQETHGPATVRTLADFAAAFLVHAREFYRNADGEPTSRFAIYRRYLGDLLERWGERDVDDIGRDEVKTVQEAWRQQSLCRSTCNQALTTLKAAFRWGADEGLVRPETLASILAVKGLPAGRNLAREYEPVQPVPDEHVEATIAELHAPLCDMVRLQWLAGCRPGELRRLRGEEIDREGRAHVNGQRVHEAGVWAFLPRQHKLRYKGKVIVYWLGPRAQAVLAPYLLRAGTGYVFPSGKTSCYCEQYYYRVIELACQRAGVPAWAPNRLRHSCACRYDEASGLQAASAVLGHARVETTAIYAQKNLKQAAELVRRLG